MQNRNPVSYASRSLTNAQKNYAVIKKELLAFLFGCEIFHQSVHQSVIAVLPSYNFYLFFSIELSSVNCFLFFFLFLFTCSSLFLIFFTSFCTSVFIDFFPTSFLTASVTYYSSDVRTFTKQHLQTCEILHFRVMKQNSTWIKIMSRFQVDQNYG